MTESTEETGADVVLEIAVTLGTGGKMFVALDRDAARALYETLRARFEAQEDVWADYLPHAPSPGVLWYDTAAQEAPHD